MKPLVDLAYDSIRAGAPGLSDATCKVIAASIARKALQPQPSQQAGAEGEINEWVSAEVANNIHGSMAGDEVVTAECAVEIARGAALRALAALKPVEG